MVLSETFYTLGMNIQNLEVHNLENNMVKDIFTLQIDTDDYYIFERLEERIKFEIPNVTEVNLISMK